MSIKETLGLRSHREDPKMFWFALTLLCLLVGGAGMLLSLANFPGVFGVACSMAMWVGLSWALLCALLTQAAATAKANMPGHQQKQLENLILSLTAAAVVLEQLVYLFPDCAPGSPIVFAGVALYFIVRTAGARLQKKQTLVTQDILIILACGMLAYLLIVPFLDAVAGVVSTL